MARGGIAAAFALGIAAGLLLGRLSTSTRPIDVRRVDDPAPPSPRPDPPALALGPDSPSSAPVPPSDARDRAVRFPPGEERARPAELPRLRVRVRDAEGEPVRNAVVYALPAGAPGAADAATTDAETGGEYSLTLPGSGRYDVGAIRWMAHALVEDVVAPSSETVEVRLPAVAPVEFSATESLQERLRTTVPPKPSIGPPDGGGRLDPVEIRLVSVGVARSSEYPGRREGLDTTRWYAVRLRKEAPATSVRLPRGVPWRVEDVRSRVPVRVERSEFTAPARVSVDAEGWRLVLEMAITPAGQAFGRKATVVATVSVAGLHGERTESYTFAPQERVEDRGYLRWDFRVPSRTGEVSWRGPGLRPGSAPYRVEEDGEPVLVTALVEGALAAEAPDDRPVRRVHVVLGEPGDPGQVSLETWGGEVESALEWDPDRAQGTGEIRGDASWVTAYGDEKEGWLSQSAPASALPSTDLHLRRGGWLVLAPDRPLPEGLTLRVERVDGMPLSVPRGEIWPHVRTVGAGDVLGPLLPGPLRLRVSLGTVEVGEILPEVRAGEYVLVTVPTSAPVPR